MRVRAKSLVLVNWRSVFYERYTLDEHVTALEGDNGAGKTTVMIAAYVVLLPDMTRLRFTNVGEGEATGGDKGIHGRLGHSGRPSYSVIEFEVGCERLLAGIRLEPKGEPSVDLTPFVITNLPSSVGLQDLLLRREGDEELIPELDELRESAARFGARFDRCNTLKDYFAILFEHGITPLRLATDDDRNRFGDMLRTSMTGGISRAMTNELRSFLLKEERGLADTLVRMRGNLDACRRTRTEVQDSRILEREISGVYQAGHDMFSAAMSATRERSDEMRRLVDSAKEQRDEALGERDRVEAETERQVRTREVVGGELLKAQGEHSFAVEALGHVERANKIAGRMRTDRVDLEEASRDLAQASESLANAEAQRVARTSEQARAEENFERAAAGLADLQKGLEELHRRANAHRMAKARLAEACEALGVQDIDAEQIDSHCVAAELEKQSIDEERGELDERLTRAEQHGQRHAQALQALESLAGEPVDVDHAHIRAANTLAELTRLESLAEQLDALNRELADLQSRCVRQQAARQLAKTLARVPDQFNSQTGVKAGVKAIALELKAQQDELHALEGQSAEVRRKLLEHTQWQRKLEDRGNRWRELDALAARLEGELGAGLRTADELGVAQELLDEHGDELRHTRDALAVTAEQMAGEARALAQCGGAFANGLLAARDVVEGQLLAGYFDDIKTDRAGWMQALLGPLAQAIVVEDAEKAAALLLAHEPDLESIWLIEGPQAGALVDLTEDNDTAGAYVKVEEGETLRVTRISPRPTLGRKARQRRIAELGKQIEANAIERTDVERRLGQLAMRRRELTVLLGEIETLAAGDPSDELLQHTAARRDFIRQQKLLVRRMETLTGEHQSSTTRAERLRDLLGEAHLLDLDDLGQRVATLTARHCEAQSAGERLLQTRKAREALVEYRDALRSPPLSGINITNLKTRFARLGARRQELFSALDALTYISGHREALAWSDAEAALENEQDLLPILRRQHDGAKRDRDAAVKAARRAGDAHADVRARWNEIDARHKAFNAQLQLAHKELTETGVEDPSDAALIRARERETQLEVKAKALDGRHRTIENELSALEERLRGRQENLEVKQRQLAMQERECQPSLKRWERLRTKADAAGLISASIAKRLLVSGSGSPNLNSEARSHARVLLERLRVARGGDEILDQIQSWLDGQEQTAGDNYLEAWSLVRSWLRRRIPAHVAEVDEPLEALERLRTHLDALDARLARDEEVLRGTSEDVGNGIDVHIRSAKRQVKRLNSSLQGVHFGTIQSMRIMLDRKPDMERVLVALRKGAAQELLFSTAMPIEQALEQLFSRHGSGRTGGQKLLDYREYLTINVEILRQTESTWERVNPSRVSTGEAIGIGAALMMVVLTAWERAANLLRAKRSLGTLRLLFLDEANRLSRDNLEVLFELCKNLDLQLLIAAPEVAQAQGCTTFRLVRQKTADGNEEVLVSGRRVRVGVSS